MRYDKLDILRWTAIVFMIIFHINYSLSKIFWINTLNFSDFFWFIIWKIWVILFIIISWISFFLAEKKYRDKINKKYLKYSIFLWVIAIFITLITYFFIPSQIILFGIIHFFSISFLLIVFLRKLRYFNLIIWTIITILPFFINMKTKYSYLSFLWFIKPPFYSSDFYPLIPYFWFFLISYSLSIFLDKTWLLKKIFWWNYNGYFWKWLKYFWKNSLTIYLIHQPIIITIIYILKKI